MKRLSWIFSPFHEQLTESQNSPVVGAVPQSAGCKPPRLPNTQHHACFSRGQIIQGEIKNFNWDQMENIINSAGCGSMQRRGALRQKAKKKNKKLSLRWLRHDQKAS